MSIGLGCAGRLRVCLLPTSRKLCADSVGTSQKGRWKVTLAVVSTFIIFLVCCAAESPVKAPLLPHASHQRIALVPIFCHKFSRPLWRRLSVTLTLQSCCPVAGGFNGSRRPRHPPRGRSAPSARASPEATSLQPALEARPGARRSIGSLPRSRAPPTNAAAHRSRLCERADRHRYARGHASAALRRR